MEDGGLNRFDGRSFRRFLRSANNPATTRSGRSSKTAHGVLWVGTDGGLSRRNGERFHTFGTPQGLASERVWALHEARDGAIYIGTYAGLDVLGCQRDYAGRSRSGPRAAASARCTRIARAICGWAPMSPASSSATATDTFRTFTTRDGMASDRILSIVEGQDGTLWVGGRGGLTRIAGDALSAFTTREGFVDDVILQIAEDRRGHLWLGSARGIFRVPTAELTAVAERRAARVSVMAFGTHDGLRTDHTTGGSQRGAIRDSDGRLWFATLKGLSRVDPGSLPDRIEVPPVTIERVVLNETETLLAGPPDTGRC